MSTNCILHVKKKIARLFFLSAIQFLIECSFFSFKFYELSKLSNVLLLSLLTTFICFKVAAYWPNLVIGLFCSTRIQAWEVNMV